MGPQAARGPGGLRTNAEIRSYYEDGREASRLLSGPDLLEFARTQEILRRHLPPPPARVVDAGGVHLDELTRDQHACLTDLRAGT